MRGRETGTLEYYDARTRKWKFLRTVFVGQANRYFYVRTRARGKYFRLAWDGRLSRKTVPK